LIKDVKKDVITCTELVKKLAKNVLKLLMIILCKKEKILNLSSEKIQNLPLKRKNELNFQRAGTQFSQMPMLVLKLPPPW
jgi:ribosomal protein L22